jgi:large subunit ribosomal protein L25
MINVEMKTLKREETGKNIAKKMRKDNYIPGVIYSKGQETQHILVSLSEFQKVYKAVGISSTFYLNLENSKIPVIIKEIQKEPLGNGIYHIDFQKLNMDEKVKMTIPITILNRDNIRVQPSTLMQHLDSIEIECLPKDIPNIIELDVVDIDFNTPKMVKDLNIANNPNITIARDLDEVICTLIAPTTTNDEDEEEVEDEETKEIELEEE